jgi:GH35 family endo-1,4-beta-xylanase
VSSCAITCRSWTADNAASDWWGMQQTKFLVRKYTIISKTLTRVLPFEAQNIALYTIQIKSRYVKVKSNTNKFIGRHWNMLKPENELNEKTTRKKKDIIERIKQA